MIVDLLFIAAAIVVLIAIYKIKFSKESLQKEIHQATQKVEEKAIQKYQKSKISEDSTNLNQNNEGPQWDNDSQSGSDEGDEQFDKRKQLRKQQKQKQKQQRKQAQQYYLQQQKQKREKYEKQVQERERIEEERRKKEEEIIQQLRQQERKRKQQEFNKWKDMFKVEEEGKQKLTEQEQKRKADQFNKSLLNLLKKNKLLLLEDLSHKFKLPIKEVVQKIKNLQSLGQVSGIFDERGKYLVIQDNQWAAIRNYITARGRVKKTDIMTQCARLIKIPENVEQDLLELVKQEAA